MRFSEPVEARLAAFEVLLRRWNRTVNLVAASTLPDLRARHIEDSAQLAALLPPGARRWVDLGTGGGFPGLVVAAILAESAPSVQMHLVEADGRKAAFLAEAARQLGLAATVHARRIEDLAPLAADVVSARALAPLPALLPLAARHMAAGATGLFLKGARVDEELAAARTHWTFEAEVGQSRSGGGGVIVRTGGIRRAG
jgi:16S rRNA (guanine527-N7)-methyltransferase